MSWKSLATPLAVVIVGVIVMVGALAAADAGGPLSPYRDDYPASTLTAQASITPSIQSEYPEPGTPTTTVTASPENPTTTIAPPPLPPSALPSATAPAPESPELAVTPTPSDALTCAPGEPVLISGQGPPRAAFLLYFGQRAVSGGSVSPDGHFAIPLVVGHERPGVYQVSVRVRGTDQVLRELTCAVPVPPTPTPPSHRPFSP